MQVPNQCAGVLAAQSVSGRGNTANGGVLTVAFSSTGAYCMSGGQDRLVRLWNPHKGTLIKTYALQHGYDIHSVQM